MRYISTRGGGPGVAFSEAVAAGLAPDGGLFVPSELPDLSSELSSYRGLPYATLATRFLRLFASDIPEAELSGLLTQAYAGFEHPEVVPLKDLGPGLHVLELFHGPTLAFKDLALQFLGPVYARQCAQRGETINVLGATSGDTGAAAIHGLMGRPGVAIFILYPDGRISPLQERQMACTGAANVYALAITGSFDDAQAVLKEIFADQEYKAGRRLSAVNSINIARILAQCVYYLYAWLRLPPSEQESAEFVVPTGNFGNVLAGLMVQRMGVPIARFRVATNQNDILHRYFLTGEYRVGEVHPSLAPSMDIQVASNFERFLYYTLDHDPAAVKAAMTAIRTEGNYRHPRGAPVGIGSSRCMDTDIVRHIRDIHGRYEYIPDPHTACAFEGFSKTRPSVVLATAHPAKFPETIREAIGIEPKHPSLEALRDRPVVKHKIVADAAAIRAFIDSRAV